MLFSADGRIRRRDWWLYSVLTLVLSGVLFFVVFFVLAVLGRIKPNDPLAPILGNLYFPLFCWMIVCIASKRWHDRGKSGYMSLLTFVPGVGLVWTIIECGILDGIHGPNKYGPSPKGLNHEENLF
jgi:uncharacterized membrane protein YhaH (DUF805 family)